MPKKMSKDVSDEMRAMMEADAAKGLENIRVSDRAFWLEYDGGQNNDWFNALEAIDKSTGKNKAALIKLLRSKHEPTAIVRLCIADLLERYEFSRPRGGQRAPAYDKTPAEQIIALAITAVETLTSRPHNLSVSKAVERVAPRFKLSVETLEIAYGGRRGSTQRAKARLRPPA
jgi:hypothetical protein